MKRKTFKKKHLRKKRKSQAGQGKAWNKIKGWVKGNMDGTNKSPWNYAAHALIPGYTLAVGGYPGQAKMTLKKLTTGSFT